MALSERARKLLESTSQGRAALEAGGDAAFARQERRRKRRRRSRYVEGLLAKFKDMYPGWFRDSGQVREAGPSRKPETTIHTDAYPSGKRLAAFERERPGRPAEAFKPNAARVAAILAAAPAMRK